MDEENFELRFDIQELRLMGELTFGSLMFFETCCDAIDFSELMRVPT